MKRNLTALTAAILVIACTAVAATSAAAEELLAEWLLNGATITSSLSSKTTGETVLRDGALGIAVSCSAVFDGSVAANGEDSITEMLSLGGVAVTLTSPLLCKSVEGCEESASDIEVAPEKLPWSSLLTLVGTKMVDLLKEVTFFAGCLVIGIKTSEECSSSSSEFEVLNVASGVEVVGSSTPLANCSVGGNGTGEVCVFEDVVTPNEGGTLAVSSE